MVEHSSHKRTVIGSIPIWSIKHARIEGGEVAGYENIKDANNNRTPEERRELAKRAGEASGRARRRKADFRRTLNMLLTAEIDSEEWKPILESLGVECTLESALLMAQIKEAMSGNTKAAYFVAQYAGQNGQTMADDEEQKRRMERMAADIEKIRRSSGSAENEDEGVEIINDAPKETSEDIGACDSKISENI